MTNKLTLVDCYLDSWSFLVFSYGYVSDEFMYEEESERET